MEDGGYGTSEVFTRRGGLWFGTYHLLNYPANYSAPASASPTSTRCRYASRNAAFQNAVSKAIVGKLSALDGDLIRYNSKEPGKQKVSGAQTGRAVLGMSEREIRSQLEKGDSPGRLKNGALQESL